MTLIKNLEVYGLDPAAVATALQRRVQASSVLQPIPGAKDKVLVQIQGNQIHQVGNLLLGLELNNTWNIIYPYGFCAKVFRVCDLFNISDHYQIPRKYLQGLDKAPKGGKKK